MTPKFRAYDSGSLSRMYQPDEVMVGNGDIWIIEEDSVAGDWIVNNDLNLMQSTGLCDKEGTEVFEGDILHHQIQTEYTFIVKYDKERQQLIVKNFQKSMSTIIRISDIKRIRLVPNTIREAQKRNSNLK